MYHGTRWLCGLLLLFTLPALATQPAAAAGGNVLRATLKNGLQVVVVRNTLAPVVTTQVNYRVGSNEAPKGFPGTAHAVEHMMFRGSPGLSRDQLAQIGALMGGSFNAATTQSVTQYFYTVPAADLAIALHVEALRMAGLNVTKTDWHKERGAIEQEVSRDLSDPQYRFYSHLLSVMFAGTPYAHDALGTRPSFNETSAKMLRDFHDHWYAPNNAILVIVGYVDPQATLKAVKKLFGPIPSKKLPERQTIDLQPIKAQTLRLTTDRPYGMTVIAYRMPGYLSPDFATGVILADALGSRRGRINALVPEGKALQAGFDQSSLRKSGLGFADALFPKGADAGKLLETLAQRVAEIRKQGVPKDLVEAAKAQEIAQLELQKNSVAGLARAWSTALAFQDLDSPEAMKAAFAAVTVADVNRLARLVLDPGHAISAVLTPKPSGKPVSRKGYGGAETISVTPTHEVKLPDWAARLEHKATVPEPTLDPVVSTLPNGIKLIVQPVTVSDTVSVYGSVHTRASLQQPKGQEGVGSVLDSLFGYGGGKLDRSAFQAALDAIAAQEEGGTGFAVQAPVAHFDRAVQLLALNELQPRFPKRAFEVVQRQTAGALDGMLQSPGYLFHRTLSEALLPAEDPGLRQATPKTVAALTLDDVKAYYDKIFRPDLTTIVVIGDITPKDARQTIEEYFGDWKAKGDKPDLNLPAVPDNAASSHHVPDDSAVQDSVVLAQTLSITLDDPQHYALDLGNVLLGQGFYASRLYRDLRARAGLVYTVGSRLSFGQTRSVYRINYGCDPDNVAKARAIVLRDLKDMQKNPVDRADLARAKAMLIRQIPLQQASVGGIAQAWLYYTEHDLPLDQATVVARQVSGLTAKDVQKAFKQWLRPEDLVEVVKGPKPG